MAAGQERGEAAFEFGAFRFDPVERVLYRDSERVPLSPKVADTLLVLLTHHGRVVDKNELIQLVWPDTFVEEGGLTRNISILRKALGDDADSSRHIETIPKRGYRFVAPLKSASPEPDAAGARKTGASRSVRPRAAAMLVGSAALVLAGAVYLAWHRNSGDPAPYRIHSLAVLPLKNISGGPGQDYFAEGMTDVIATELSKSGLAVIAPASVRRLRAGAPLDEIGRRLNVEAVIQGTVLEAGERVRINAQLVEVRTGRMLWADSYQRDLRDVLSLQAEVANAIARRATSEVAAARKPAAPALPPVVPEAYQAYLKGRFFWNKRSEPALRRAVEYFNEAIASDRTYAPAYAGLADSWALLGSSFYDAVPPREAMPRAQAAALRALELDAGLAEAHTSLAYVRMAYDWDLGAAEAEFQRALRCNPGYATAHHWRAHCLLAAGRMDEASAEMRQAQKLDPLSLPVNVGVGWCSYFGRRYDEAIRQYRATLELEPGFALAHQALGMALLRKQAYREAIAEFQASIRFSGEAAGAVASLGYAYALTGAKSEARAQLERLAQLSQHRYVPAMYMALVYLGLQDSHRFSSWLSKAREERSEYLIYYRVDPNFETVRANPSFKLEPGIAGRGNSVRKL